MKRGLWAPSGFDIWVSSKKLFRVKSLFRNFICLLDLGYLNGNDLSSLMAYFILLEDSI